jgi:UDP-glucose 4-epimerase
MKILITGGMGFIGKHLIEYLLKKRNEITVFDNFSNSNKDLIQSFESRNVNVIEGDITKITEISNATKNQEIVIHLAAKISVDESIRDPEETYHVNVDGTKNVLKSCEKNNIKKLIVSSSAAVYGEGFPKTKLNENMQTNPISPYGKSKLKMEQEIKKFISEHNTFDCIILRFFNIYGIGQSSEYAGVITKFIEKISKSEPIKIFGDGLQTRDFISIEDVIESIFNAILYGKYGSYNIASGNPITINELAELVISLSKKNTKIHHYPARKGDIKFSSADINLAKKEIKYVPKFGIKKIQELL